MQQQSLFGKKRPQTQSLTRKQNNRRFVTNLKTKTIIIKKKLCTGVFKLFIASHSLEGSLWFLWR